MRKYRRIDKRRAYSDYAIQSNGLKEDLTAGKISQEEFERAHNMLDDKYGWIK